VKKTEKQTKRYIEQVVMVQISAWIQQLEGLPSLTLVTFYISSSLFRCTH